MIDTLIGTAVMFAALAGLVLAVRGLGKGYMWLWRRFDPEGAPRVGETGEQHRRRKQMERQRVLRGCRT